MRAIGVDIGGTFIKAGLVEDGAVIARAKAPTPRGGEELAEAVAELTRDYGDLPLGAACAGSVTPDGRVLADNLGWQEGLPLARLLKAALGREAAVLNDAAAALIAEWRLGALKGARHSLLLTFGTGIGSGAIVNGAPYDGRDGRGIELGHIITHAGGPLCACGQRGCFELYACAGALARAMGLPTREALSRARAGEGGEGWREYLREVSVGLLSCLSAYAPEVVALGGGMAGDDDFFVGSVARACRETDGYDRLYGDVTFVRARFGNDAGVVGAALEAAARA